MRSAARPAFIDTSGVPARVENHPYSWLRAPPNFACRWEPVRIRPGYTAVTLTPLPAVSARRPSARTPIAALAHE
ncbi:hypothetical protein SALBM135S_09646 [Streptomyces alboniger]